ncbi:hypothetical protein EDD65_102265 [Keratinibaculum paraultunense]|uniref:Uncharacterized protein n=2 Tax=Keratinibaculum paraultunense TaxID=1278232 RepID=A0A4R3KYT1_9FIRM|nr:hypothetical protein EDD65_102265 [Keratinibaculum paraultunense]
MNSSQNNVQAFYVAEGKILMAINNPKYFDNLILPEIKEYLKNDKIIDNNKEYIVLDDEDLMEGDSDNKINLFFYEEENREKLKLQTQTSYNKIKRKADANLTVINQLFEMGLPILSPNLLEGNAKLYEEYMDFLQQKIYIPTLEEDIMPIEIDNYEIIKIFNDMDRRTYVELYRNNISSSINKRLIDIKDRVFILVRNNKIKGTKMVIESNNINDILELKGIIYVEGDIYICSDVIFDGILIVNNGSIYIESDSNFMLSGILLGDDADKMLYDKRVKLDYNLHEIKRNGVYLPGFIEPNIEYIKIY